MSHTPFIWAAYTIGAIVLTLSFQRERDRRNFSHCISNLCQITAAKNQYIIDHSATNGTLVTREQLAPTSTVGAVFVSGSTVTTT